MKCRHPTTTFSRVQPTKKVVPLTKTHPNILVGENRLHPKSPRDQAARVLTQGAARNSSISAGPNLWFARLAILLPPFPDPLPLWTYPQKDNSKGQTQKIKSKQGVGSDRSEQGSFEGSKRVKHKVKWRTIFLTPFFLCVMSGFLPLGKQNQVFSQPRQS